MNNNGNLENIIEPLLAGLGLVLVECSVAKHRGNTSVMLVLWRENGISLDDLTEAQNIIRPRLELEFDRRSLSVEISSPGTSRTIKSRREYDIFTGRRIRLLTGETWVAGILQGADEQNVTIICDGRELQIPCNQIRKAQLKEIAGQ